MEAKKKFEVIITPAADEQIREQAKWYELQREGLGSSFHDKVDEIVLLLKTNPYAQVRYDNVRCVPIKGFPVMLHIGVDEENRVVKVHALIHTARDPDSHWGRTDWFVSEPEMVYGVA